ncbi:hypothetical protein B0J11DRAFT_134348 [Dendryphion nanum]|uniref:DC-UbP/UBTD2 N-terminal domain-containing protein n=1 Tax=Dendryphion nanum TaxID=256645 RepID=A0A9P9D7U1_9PLEO|nr:hypothetical protein B0J11DRAFT_134348 [Dendryphion nanum]
MGCCFGRPEGGVYHQDSTEDPSSSSRRIAPNSNRTSQSQPNDPHPENLAARNNRPLKPIQPETRVIIQDPNRDPNGPVVPISWTRARLEQERREWWETRTEGQSSIWDVYRTCVYALQNGDVDNAQAILDAAGCTCPSGELWRRIFGPDGVEYTVSNARWVVLEPAALLEDEEVGVHRQDVHRGKIIPIGPVSRKSSSVDGEQLSPHFPASISVKCRLSDTAKDVTVDLPGDAVVADLIRRLRDNLGYRDQNLSVAFMGKRYVSESLICDFYTEDNVLVIMVQPRLDRP